MTVAFRAESHRITTDTATSPDPGEPAGTASGDILIFLGVIDAAATTWNRPAGSTSLYSGTLTDFKYELSWVARGGGAATTLWSKNAASLYYEIYCLAISGGNTSALDATSASGATGSATSHNPDPPAVTAVNSACLAICGGIYWNGSGTSWGAPSGYTIRSNNAAGNDGVMATKLLSASGSENPGAFSGTNSGTSHNYWDGFTITIAPPGAGGATVSFLPLLGVG